MAYNISDNTIHVYQHDDPTQEIATVSSDSVMKLRTTEQISYLGDELAFDTMDLEARQERSFQNGQAVYDTQLTAFPYGSPVRHENAGGGIDRTFYIDTSSRIGNHVFRYDCASIIAMLDRQTFGGNVYGMTYFYAVLEGILGASGTIFDYDCTNVRNVLVSGWIPYGTKRTALQQLLFATNVHAFWDKTNQRVVFDYIDHTSAGTVADANIFDDGKVEYPQLATNVSVVEHDFFFYNSENVSPVVLYDNTQGNSADTEFVKFSGAPIHVGSLVTTGTLTISNATTDSCYVTGRGKLTGKPYFHVTMPISRKANVATRQEYNIAVNDAYLISFLNSENVADRLADYYFDRYVVKADIKQQGDEECGKFYTLKDSFGDTQTGYLQKMEKVYSSFVRSSCEFICGVDEEYEANTFHYFRTIYHNTNTYNDEPEPGTAPLVGTWTVPAGVTKIRVVLVGGGKGGDSGTPGSPGEASGAGGKGGKAGASGSGGKIFITTIDVNPGDVFNYSLGEGGAGGAILTYADYQTLGHERYGADGGDTTFQKVGDSTVYSSGNGASTDIGFHFTAVGSMIAMPGGDMTWGAGGDGGDAGQTSDNADETAKRTGKPGQSVQFQTLNVSGGAGGAGTFVSAPTSFNTIINQQYTALTGLYYVANGQNPPPVWYAYTSASDKQGLWNNAKIGQNYIDYTGWKCSVGIPGGGGGGAAFSQQGGAGGAGWNESSYPSNFYGDYDTGRVLRDGDSWCWHETNKTHGGNGGAGANATASYVKYQYSRDSNYGYTWALGIGGRGGFGGGGGGGAAASVSKQSTVQWLFTEFVESTTKPTGGAGGYGGKGQDGADGGIIIYY